MAYSAYCDTAVATKWWIIGTGSTVNRLSEVMDDNPSGVEEADNLGNYQPWTTFMTETVEDAVYLIHLPFEIGDGSTATTLTSLNEMVYFDDSCYPEVQASASLTIGVLQGSYGKTGSCWNIGGIAATPYNFLDGGTLSIYASLIMVRLNSHTYFNTGDLIIKNSVLAYTATNPASDFRYYYRFRSGLTSLNLEDIYCNNVYALRFDTIADSCINVRSHYSAFGVWTQAVTVVTDVKITDPINKALFADVTGSTLTVINQTGDALTSSNVANNTDNTNIIYEQYTVNIHLTDKDGEAIADTATVACTRANIVSNGGNYYKCITAHTSGTFADDLAAGKWEQITDATIISAAPAWLTSTAYVSAEAVFSVNPTSGSIAEQTVTVRKWTGTSELETKYIFDFTFSETGYQTLVKNNVPILGAVDWRLEIQDLGHGGIRRPIFLIEE